MGSPVEPKRAPGQPLTNEPTSIGQGPFVRGVCRSRFVICRSRFVRCRSRFARYRSRFARCRSRFVLCRSRFKTKRDLQRAKRDLHRSKRDLHRTKRDLHRTKRDLHRTKRDFRPYFIRCVLYASGLSFFAPSCAQVPNAVLLFDRSFLIAAYECFEEKPARRGCEVAQSKCRVTPCQAPCLR